MSNNTVTLEDILNDIKTVNKLVQDIGVMVALLASADPKARIKFRDIEDPKARIKFREIKTEDTPEEGKQYSVLKLSKTKKWSESEVNNEEVAPKRKSLRLTGSKVKELESDRDDLKDMIEDMFI